MSDIPTEPPALTRGRLLARNTIWSLVGQFFSMLAAFLAIPILVRGLGTDRFGVLAIVWSVIGYFSLFDLGLGRSLTQAVAERLGAGRREDLGPLVWTSLLMMLGFSIAGGVLVALAAPWIERMLRIPAGLESETVRTFQILAITLPAVVLTSGLGGVISAYQRFGLLMALRTPLGVLSFLAPLAVLPYTNDLSHVVGVIACVRMVSLIGHFVACLSVMPEMKQVRWARQLADPLLRTGGWMTLINVILTIMLTLDRFAIGAWVSISAVAFYATPQEIATKLWAVPGPLMTVLFPAFAASYQVDHERLRLLFFRGLKYVYLALFPATLIIIVLAGDGLRLWLGPEFERQSSLILQMLTIGVLFNSLSYVPSGLLQAVGRSRTLALLTIVELPIYLGVLFLLTRTWSIKGAAFAWMTRAAIDFVVVTILAEPSLGPGTMRRLWKPALITIVALIAAMLVRPLPLVPRAVFLLATLGAFGSWAWSRGLVEERRALALGA